MLCAISIYLIKNVHQKVISPKLNKRGIYCRFYPTCSEYGIIAINKYGFFKGWFKTIDRISRCRVTNHNTCVDIP
ncbi:MAG: membrane protein insertion efficiency factor YidD [Candidatus Altiarchaeota archaeon]|nr:membrane protein insertion efficiency factor YidD [Candidatus Altiarchaeota archaeon]